MNNLNDMFQPSNSFSDNNKVDNNTEELKMPRFNTKDFKLRSVFMKSLYKDTVDNESNGVHDLLSNFYFNITCQKVGLTENKEQATSMLVQGFLVLDNKEHLFAFSYPIKYNPEFPKVKRDGNIDIRNPFFADSGFLDSEFPLLLHKDNYKEIASISDSDCIDGLTELLIKDYKKISLTGIEALLYILDIDYDEYIPDVPRYNSSTLSEIIEKLNIKDKTKKYLLIMSNCSFVGMKYPDQRPWFIDWENLDEKTAKDALFAMYEDATRFCDSAAIKNGLIRLKKQFPIADNSFEVFEEIEKLYGKKYKK